MSESDSSTHYLSGVKAYIIPTKISPYAIESMKKQIEKHGIFNTIASSCCLLRKHF